MNIRAIERRCSLFLAFCFFSFVFNCTTLFGQSSTTRPPGAPGIAHSWAPAFKQAIGSAYEQQTALSPVWFTIAEGILTEVFYPQVDQAQVGDLQLLVTDGGSFFSEQKTDVAATVRYVPDGASVQISGQDRGSRYRLEQEIITDPFVPAVRIRTMFQPLRSGLKLYVLFKPAVNNSGSHNLGFASPEGLGATYSGPKPSRVHVALVSSLPWARTSAGYVGFSDGWQDLSKNFRLTQSWPEAGPGNIALIGEVAASHNNYLQSTVNFELALGFGETREGAFSNGKSALDSSFLVARDIYNNGWNMYLRELQASEPGKKEFLKKSRLAQLSAKIIKMHEDKRSRGAIVASLSKPGIPDYGRAPEGNGGGYHLVWPRDLYHAAMGLLAAGDFVTPVDVLKYFAQTQHVDGSWSQNYWVNGEVFWAGLQMDEVAFPILLASHLYRRGVHALSQGEIEMIRRASWFIARNGPYSPQDRWEEIGGFIPSTIAVEIAGLLASSRLLDDPILAEIANDWQSKIEQWTVMASGPYGKNYYLRVSPSGNPQRDEWIELANGGGGILARDVIDGGFLELVRFGVREPGDKNILNTLRIYESPELDIATGFRHQPQINEALTYRRYNRDAYGPSRIGGYWPLLAGERGNYAVMNGDLIRAQAQLNMMEQAATESGLIPEQIPSPYYSSSNSQGIACPLVWAHAEDIILSRSIEEAHVFDKP